MKYGGSGEGAMVHGGISIGDPTIAAAVESTTDEYGKFANLMPNNICRSFRGIDLTSSSLRVALLMIQQYLLN